MTTQQTTLDVRPSERVGDVLARIRRDASSEAEKGAWFEHLFMAAVRDNAEFDVADVWRWRDWPERERLTGLDGRDHGIDLVAMQTDGTVVAVQCKCHAEDAVIGKAQVDSFLTWEEIGAFLVEMLNDIGERATDRVGERRARLAADCVADANAGTVTMDYCINRYRGELRDAGLTEEALHELRERWGRTA